VTIKTTDDRAVAAVTTILLDFVYAARSEGKEWVSMTYLEDAVKRIRGRQ
jgi:hypothetical protein